MSGSVAILEDSPTLTRNSRRKLRDRTLIFRYLVIINLMLGAWYLHWRITESINWNALWLSIPLLLAEIYMYCGGVLFLVGLWRPIERQVRSLRHLSPPIPVDTYPTVDVFITCYNEPVELVETTARAALAIDYPVDKLKVYILDDGNSPAMRTMVEQLCLDDLQNPAIQSIADRLDRERNWLTSQLTQMQYLKTDIAAAEIQSKAQTLHVSSHSSELDQVLAWFDCLRAPHIPDRAWLECQTALGEGFDNAICHAHQNLPSTTSIEIEAIVQSHAVMLRIWDQGPDFDLDTKVRLLPHQIDLTVERGRGLYIIEQLTDYFTYSRTEDGRNCLVIIKEFEPLDIGQEESTVNPKLQLNSIRQLLLLSRPEHSDTSAIFLSEVKHLKQQVEQKEDQLADLARCRYIAREKPNNRPHHAKAGNINHAIFSGETSGEFILTLDADHIPKPQFLQRVLPHFFKFNLNRGYYEANQIAFVQTPQAFYNLPDSDPFGHNAHLFYGPIQQSKDGMNAAFYTGTNAILRRESLVNMGLQHFAEDFEQDETRLEEFDLIGGLSSLSITEDMNTAMRLHSAGWQSAYHNEILAVGLAPDDLSSTLKQKLRWAQGTIQVFVRDNPLLKSGLSIWQRLQYFQTIYSYFTGFFIAIFLICPIVFFFTGTIPVDSFGRDFALHFVPAYTINRLTFIIASWGIPAAELWRNEQFAIGLFPLNIQAVLSVFTGKKISFQVTPKQRQSGRYLGLVRVQLIFFLLTLLGIAVGVFHLLFQKENEPWIYVINIGWGFYHLALLWGIIYAALWQPKTEK